MWCSRHGGTDPLQRCWALASSAKPGLNSLVSRKNDGSGRALVKRLPVGLCGEEAKLSLEKQGRGAESEAAVSNLRQETGGGGAGT